MAFRASQTPLRSNGITTRELRNSIVAHLWKEVAPTFGRHVNRPQSGSTRSPARWCCFGAGGAKLISEPQKCLIAPFFFLKTLKMVSSQFSPSELYVVRAFP